MWEFPTIGQFLELEIRVIFFLPFALLVGIFSWVFLIRSMMNKKEIAFGTGLKHSIGGTALLLAAVIIFFRIVSQFGDVREFRNLDLERVRAMRVAKIENEDGFSHTFLTIKDESSIREALKQLTSSADVRPRNKARYTDGYKIQLLLENDSESEFYIWFFKQTAQGKPVNIVIPHYGDRPNGVNFDGLGIFSSAAFGEWVRENVDPQFSEKSKAPEL